MQFRMNNFNTGFHMLNCTESVMTNSGTGKCFFVLASVNAVMCFRSNSVFASILHDLNSKA